LRCHALGDIFLGFQLDVIPQFVIEFLVRLSLAK